MFWVYSIKNYVNINTTVTIKELIKKYFRFPVYTAPQNLLNAISQQMPVILLGYFFNFKVAGFYWFAVRIIQLPSKIVSDAIRKVFFRDVAEIRDDIFKVQRVFYRYTLCLFFVIVPVVIFFSFFSKDIFVIVFGKQWYIAGQYAGWMILWVATGFINPPAVMLYQLLNKQKLFLIYEILLLISRFLALWIPYIIKDDSFFTIKIYSIVGVVFNSSLICYWFFYFHYKKLENNKLGTGIPTKAAICSDFHL